jgi:DNA end-binding protein Ku
MPPRSSWKGYLKLSLVSCPVALYPTSTTTERIRFNTLNRKTGNRVKRQFIDAETGQVVENEDQVRGHEIARGQYIMIEDDELSAIALESTHTIDIESFAPRSSIDERYLDTPYYIAPDDRVGQEAFAVIRETMRKKKMVGIARVVLQRRERILMIEPLGKGLLATSLRYSNEVRQADAYFEDVPDVTLSDEMIDLASHIIERKQAPFDPSQFNDRYENAMVELIKSKQAGKPIQSAQAPRPANVINLMDALRRSIAEGERTAGVKTEVQEKSSKTKEAPRQRAIAASRRTAVKKGSPKRAGGRSSK